MLELADLEALEPVEKRRPDRTLDLTLSGGMMTSAWTINGQAYPNADALEVSEGERVRVRMINHSMMLHPMHLHGHFFRIGETLKDTVVVPPHMGRIDFDFLADNPGKWFSIATISTTWKAEWPVYLATFNSGHVRSTVAKADRRWQQIYRSWR